MSEQGEIKGRLLLDSSQFRDDIVAAKAQLDQLTSKRTDVKVTADTRTARAGLDQVTKSADAVTAAETRMKAAVQASDRATAVALLAQMRLKDVQEKRGRTALQVASAEETLRFAMQKADSAAEKAIAAEETLAAAHRTAAAGALEQAAAEETSGAAIDRVSRRADSGAGRIALWTSAIIAAVPAVFPLVGTAAAAAGALGGLGAAGILAGTGIARGMKDGSEAASQYRPLINQVLADVHQLQDTAEIGLLPGADATLTQLQGKLPEINAGVSEMAGDLGRMLPTGLDAVVTLTERGLPLWRSGADLLARMVTGIDGFAHSDAYKGFIDYSVRNGPQVERFLLHTLQLVGDIVTAWAPYGEQVLPVLDDTVVTVGNIVKALGPAVPAVAAVYLAFRTWTGVRTVLDGIMTGLQLLGVRAKTTAGEVEAAGAVSKGAGFAAAAGWSAALLALSQYAAVQTAQANYDTTYRITKGSAAQKTAAASDVSRASMVSPGSAGGGGMVVPGILGDQGQQKMAAAQQRVAAATKAATAAEQQQQSAVAGLRAQLNGASSALAAMISSQDRASATAIGLEGSYDGAKDSIAGVTAAVKSNGASLAQNTAKGRANREAILSAVSAIKAHGAEMIKDGASAIDAKVAQDKLGVQLLHTAEKAGISKKAAQEYINKLLGIPKNVSTTAQLKKDQAEAKLAAYRREVQNLDGYTATVYVSLREVGLTPGQAAQRAKNAQLGQKTGGSVLDVPGHASGATVRGPGTAATDSVLRRLSVGEEVTSNMFGQADRNRPMLKAINTGDRSRIAATAQAMYGTGPSHTVVHVIGDDTAAASMVRVAVTQGLTEQQARDARTQRMGWQGKGFLAAPTGA